jgi:hypothetical protein
MLGHGLKVQRGGVETEQGLPKGCRGQLHGVEGTLKTCKAIGRSKRLGIVLKRPAKGKKTKFEW